MVEGKKQRGPAARPGSGLRKRHILKSERGDDLHPGPYIPKSFGEKKTRPKETKGAKNA